MKLANTISNQKIMLSKILSNVIVITLGLFPQIADAQCGDNEICNPLEVDSITAFLGELVKAVTTLSIPIIVIFIIYAGFLFVTAGGDESQLETAKKTAMYTLIGAAIILGARLLSEILINTAENLGVDNLN